MEVMPRPESGSPTSWRIRELVGEGNDQFVDDMYTSNDGRLLIVSRPSFRDVVALNLTTGKIVWRFVVDGQRSDHMAISPDGRQVAVSASTGNVVHILDIKTGREVDRFPSGDSRTRTSTPTDGKRLYHASIGLVYTPADNGSIDTTRARASGTSRSSGREDAHDHSRGSTWARSWSGPGTRT